MSVNVFEWATKNRVRFDSGRGAILSVEDLWQLPLKAKTANSVSLDEVAKFIHRQIKENDELSFVDEKSTTDRTNELKFDLVKHIISVRKEEQKKAEQRKENKQRNELIQRILVEKEVSEFHEKSAEELRKILANSDD